MAALALVGLLWVYAVAMAAMGSLLVAATVPLAARAATLRRQLGQIESMIVQATVVAGASA